MEMNRLKIKIGDHEFEAEGPAEIVQAQFAAFQELIAQLPTPKPATPAPTIQTQPGDCAPANHGGSLDRIMKQDGRIVSLTARGSSLEAEIMLVLYGQKALRKNDSVTGAEIVDGLKLTGRVVGRIDYQLDKMTDAGDVITIGTRRARRYRLTNQGAMKAQEIARTLVATVA